MLLHGYPQTRALWAHVAPVLARDYTVICPDLRGYGASSKPQEVKDYAFREMGRDQLDLMAQLGFDRFDLAGHDRGGRTAHRMALDAPDRVRSLTLMDIVPTHLLLDQLSTPVARGYYHWFFLSQPAPFPERLIGADPDYYYESCLLGWGAARIEDFDPKQLIAYRAAWADPEVTRGMCNDYRAAIDVDFALDAADLGRRVTCPTMIMWGADGAMDAAFDVPGTWADRCTDITPQAMPGGHFFVDTDPAGTARALLNFLKR
ncbi:alpha/beta hydrolase [Aliiroseovarius subalbicans]|nr:alpha/beta hydrolase [Aliiroseovarius subalbicans]MCI2398705.1 alpha/beta hydrolase [Aliiroseovarius subalbicans]